MKNLYLVILASIIGQFAFSQTDGDNQIIITNRKSAKDNFVELGKTMMSEGFEIAENDDTFHTILFEPIKMEYRFGKTKTWRYLIVSGRSTDNKVILSAQHKPTGKRKKDTVYDKNRPETVEAFKIMTEVGSKLGKVTYQNKS